MPKRKKRKAAPKLHQDRFTPRKIPSGEDKISGIIRRNKLKTKMKDFIVGRKV